jgi:hypothetical protein
MQKYAARMWGASKNRDAARRMQQLIIFRTSVCCMLKLALRIQEEPIQLHRCLAKVEDICSL